MSGAPGFIPIAVDVAVEVLFLLELRKAPRAAATTTLGLFLLASDSFAYTGPGLTDKG